MKVWKDTKFRVGDLVRDNLNAPDNSYGIGVVVSVDPVHTVIEEDYPKYADQDIPGKRYDVYFTRFGTTLTFHGDYLEKV